MTDPTAPETPTPTAPPDWLIPACRTVAENACAAQLTPTPEAGRLETFAALAEWFETAASKHDEGKVPAACIGMLAHSLAGLALKYAPPEQRPGDDGTPLGLAVDDPMTGEPVENPDALPRNAAERGAVAAMRYYVAHANGDLETAVAILKVAIADEDEGMLAGLLLILAEMAGAWTTQHAYDAGELPAELAGMWEQRLASERATTQHHLHPEDDPEKVAPHGDGLYLIGVYVPGALAITDLAAYLHKQITEMWESDPGRPDRLPLCGVLHIEPVEVWQAPKAAQQGANRAIRRAAKRYRRPAHLARAWQHHGPCVESLPDEERNRIPGVDDVPLFEDPDLEAELDQMVRDLGGAE